MTDIVARLEASLHLSELPDSARQNARELFENLSRPVTVAVLGAPGAGKSALINLFLKERILPDELSGNLIEIVPGDAFAAEVSYPDGRLEAPERDELSEVRDADRVFIAAPNPVLKDMVLIEASGCGSEDALEQAIDDATERADIVLWCTHSFEDTEKKLWSRVDEQQRDHAFLLLTKADKLARKRKLAQALGALTPVAEQDFAGLLPVATLQALKALDTDPVDEDLWAGSGADGLLKRITDHVRQGRQADFDQAELFLARYASMAEEDPSEPGGRRTSQLRPQGQRRRRSRMTREVVAALRNEAEESARAPETGAQAAPPQSPAESTPAAAPAEQPPTQAAPPAEEPVREKPTTRELVVETPEPETGRVKSDSLADRLGAIRKANSKPLLTSGNAAGSGLEKIADAARAMTGLEEHPGKVLSLCAEAANDLQDVFEGALPADLISLRDEVLQTLEHLTLLQIENTAGSAADAVTILLQLKREFAARQAA